MTASFSDDEKKLLSGQSTKIAAKHGCSPQYVILIIKGQREINFPLAQRIHADLLALIDLLRPLPNKNNL